MTVAKPVVHVRATRQTLVANVAIAAMNVVTGVLAAHLLGPRGRGELAAIQLLPSVFAILAMLGMHEALAYFCARDKSRTNVYLPSAVIVALLSSVVFVAIGYAVLPPVFLRHFSPGVVYHARLYLLLIPLYALVMLPSHALRGTGAFGWWNLLRVAPAVAWLAVLLVAGSLGSTSGGALADGNLMVTAATGLLVFAVVRRNIPGPYRPEPVAGRSLLRYGLPAAGAVFPQVLNLRLDQLIMAAVLAPKELGLYVVAVAWSSAVNPVLFAIGMVLLPQVAGSDTDKARDEVLVRAVRVGAWTTISMVALVVAATPFAFGLLFPAAFSDAVPAAVVLVVAGGLFGFNFILSEGVRGLGQPKVTLYAELVGLAVTAVALAVFLRWLGIMGAALGSVAGYAAISAVLLHHLRRQIPNLRRNTLTWSAACEAIDAMTRLVKRQSID